MGQSFGTRYITKRIAFGLLVVAIGFSFTAYVAGFRVINPLDASWIIDDSAQSYLGWLFFRNEHELNLPIGWTTKLGYPLGLPIAYLDAFPLVAALLWPMKELLPTPFQYHGLVFALESILQLYFGFRISMRITDGQRGLSFLAGLLFMTAPPFVWRMLGHLALASHWALLAAIEIYLVARLSNGRLWMIAGAVLCAVAGGINPYIASMVLMILSAAYLRWLLRSDAVQGVRIRKISMVLVGLSASMALAIVALLVFGFVRPNEANSYVGEGYGVYSMNLLALVDPMEFPALLFPPLPSIPGQYEGYNYLGLGVIMLAIVASMTRPSLATRVSMRDAFSLGLLILTSLIFAMSTKATVGSFTLYELQPPNSVLRFLSAFRASGRFFWPGYYIILTGCIVLAIAAFQKKAGPALLLCLAIQVFDLHGLYNYIGDRWKIASAATFTDQTHWQRIARAHRNLLIVPPWQCDAGMSPAGERGFWIFGKLAAAHDMTINSFYTGRTSPSQIEYFCNRQPSEIRKYGFVTDSAYVFPSMQSVIGYKTGDHFCSAMDGVVACFRDDKKRGIDPNLLAGIPITPLGERISFGLSGLQSTALIGIGWSAAEPWGRWSNARESTLVLKLFDPSTSVRLSLTIVPFVSGAHIQRVELTANDRVVANRTFMAWQDEQITADIPVGTADENGLILLRFSLPDATSPLSVGYSSATRNLGIGLRSLVLEPYAN